MIIDLNQYDAEQDAPSLRISYDACDQCHYIHRDFRGPYKTLARICLLRVSDRDFQASGRLARQCLDELIRMGHTYGGGICRLRHNDAARVLLIRIAELIEHGDTDLFPSPSNPVMPDTGMQELTVRLSEGNQRAVRPEINEYAAVLQTLDVNFQNERLGVPYNEASQDPFEQRVAERERAGR